MDKTCVQVPPVLRKEKKKHVKDELDRLKQAEKKKRQLEKALATSAAIRSELEKKKQKKKEEQQRFDEEGAAIAEAVALQVLCDDSDESCQIELNKDQGYKLNMLEHVNAGFFVEGMQTLPAYQGFAKYPVEGIAWVSEAYGSGCKWRDYGIGWSNPHGMLGMDYWAPYFIERGLSAEVSDGLIAAQAISSLQIADDIGNKANLR